ncbi:hypothetical protein GCM10011494_37010 [Novosphingobium endophyticum]|uniref:Alpha/beta hydrolase fold-3 domain-containing protein n=2 Tax=Novosphingobium endophyticum TaxID=1955250 RepID=A0A916X769_9SPHN|nr:hypothetical protein GCM10011494_37010 [Novosphingobium endophyticum]
MTMFTRREIARAAGILAVGAALPWSDRVVAASAAPPAPDPLAMVAPELREAARQILAIGKQMPPMSANTLPSVRASMARYEKPRLPDVPVKQHRIPVAGAPDVSVYVVNAQPGVIRPAILHAHGGGYVTGWAALKVPALQRLAKDLDCVVVSVDYRLAPETTYKGSIEDNYAGLKWMHAHARELGIDPHRIAIMGESAGGGHAALLAIAARDRGEVPVVFQALVYPMLDDRTGSSRTVPPHVGQIGWTAQSNRFGWQSFLGQQPGGPNVPAAAVPARTVDLSGLPPAFIGVGSIDLFVDEDIEYARRLIDAGVATELLVVPGAFHGFDSVADSSLAIQFNAAKRNALRRAFDTTGQAPTRR